MKVAFSKTKITPKDFIGKSMAGYTRQHYCIGKLDDIYANGILIESDKKEKQNLLLISLDLLKIPLMLANYIKKKLEREFPEINSGKTLIHCTHTHSAPDLTGEFFWTGGMLSVMRGIMFGSNRNDRYIVWFVHQIVSMVQNLFKTLKPCKIAFRKKKFNPDIVINRRDPKRQSSPDLGIISFINVMDDKLIGFIINYSCHPTTLSYKNKKLSADYPGKIIERTSQLTSDRVKVIFFNGAAGDLNPITTCGTDYEGLDLDKIQISDQLGTYKHTEQIGYTIAEEALNLAELIPKSEYFDNLEFKSYLKFIKIPLKDFKYFSIAWFRNKLGYIIKKFLIRVAMVLYEKANFPLFTLTREKLKIKIKTVIQFIKIDLKSKLKSSTIGLITVPGELFEEYEKLYLSKSPTGKESSFIFQNSNDWIGYLFTPEDYIVEGGYEPIASFSPVGGYLIEKEITQLFNSIKKNQI